MVFAVASVTDLLDGELARRRGLVTDFGKIADPIADKALTGAALVGLSVLGELPWWVTVVILVRELGGHRAAFWVIRHGVIPASRGGKVKTLLQVVAIACTSCPARLGSTRAMVMAAAVVVTVVTGADYAARAVRLRRRCRAAPERPVSPARPAVGPCRRAELAGQVIALLIGRQPDASPWPSR